MAPSAASSPHYSPGQEADGKLKFKTLQLTLGVDVMEHVEETNKAGPTTNKQ